MLFMLKTVMVVASGVRLSSGDGCGIMVVLMFGFRLWFRVNPGQTRSTYVKISQQQSTRSDVGSSQHIGSCGSWFGSVGSVKPSRLSGSTRSTRSN
ncbi:hypothetical protein HanPSC8_Chr13g0551681 [Helianthus annuus]|nr:hypothetical protein HanPSC8_Chr13g0551681 [Helianthus annuus]